MRETIGEVKCPFHPRPRKAEVRRNANGKLYFFCPNGCGPVNVHGLAFQEWIFENAHLYSAEELTA